MIQKVPFFYFSMSCDFYPYIVSSLTPSVRLFEREIKNVTTGLTSSNQIKHTLIYPILTYQAARLLLERRFFERR